MFDLQIVKKFAFALIISLIVSAAVFAQTTAFTYQGRLVDATAPQPTNGAYEMQFKFYTTAGINTGTQIGDAQTVPSVQVAGGIFTVSLEAENSFNSGTDLFIEISVRPAGSGAALTTLAPRQQVTSAPYAIRSRNALTAVSANDSDKLGGIAANSYVQTADSRLSDARTPLAGSADYIQNTSAPQAAANFNVSGNGTAGGTLSGNAVNSQTNFKIGNAAVFSTPNSTSVVAGQSANHSALGGNSAFFGYQAGLTTTGANNTFFGALSGSTTTVGANNTFFGFNSKSSNGNRNVAVGADANAFGSDNVLLGYQTAADGSRNTVIGSNAAAVGSIVNSTAIGYGASVTASNTIVLGTNLQETRIPGALSVSGKTQIVTLGAAGSTSLCRNAALEISTCTAGNFAEKSANAAVLQNLGEQNSLLKNQLERQQKQIAEQEENSKQLKLQIDALRKIVCGISPAAQICVQ